MALVQAKQLATQGGNATSIALTLDSAITAGSHVIVYASCGTNTAGAIASCSDGTNSFTPSAAQKNDTGNGQCARGFYYENHPGGTSTITVSLNGSYPYRTVTVAEYDTLGAFRAGVNNYQASPGNSANAITSGALGATAGDTIIGFTQETSSGTVAASVGTGFTLIGTAAPDATAEYGTAVDGTTAARFTTASPSDSYLTVGMAFAPGSVITSGSGSLTSQSATISGSASVGGSATGTGALQAQNSTMSGSGDVQPIHSSGSLQAQSSTISGSAAKTNLDSKTAMLFPSNLQSQSDLRVVWTGANFLPRNPHTAIWHVKHNQQNGYYAVAWHSQYNGAFLPGNDEWGFGTHPFPSDGSYDSEGANTFPGPYPSESQHFFEIADSGNDYLSSPSSDGTQANLELQPDVWYVQARTSEIIGSYVHMTYWPDLINNPTFKIHRQKLTSALGSTPTSPAFYFGASDWTNQGGTTSDEALSGYLRGIKLFDDVLDISDIITEATAETNVPQTTAGAASVWYTNINPTATDISDKSGAGHDPIFDNANRPTTYTIATTAGALQAQNSSISGSGSVVSGTKTASGDLQSQDATLSGTSIVNSTVVSSGALQAQDATLSGVAGVIQAVSGSGSLQSQAATVSGSALDFQVVTGVSILLDSSSLFLNLDFTPVDGDKVGIPRDYLGSSITLNANGTFLIDPALPNGTQIPRISYDTSTSTWYEDVITINDTGSLIIYSSGGLQAQPASMSGVGSGYTAITSSGALTAQSAVVTGSATKHQNITASGALQAQEATISGAGSNVIKKIIIASPNNVVDINGDPVTHTFDYWFLTDSSNIDLNAYNEEVVNIIDKGTSLALVAGEGEILVSLAVLGQSYRLVAFDGDESNYFRYTGTVVEGS